VNEERPRLTAMSSSAIWGEGDECGRRLDPRV